MWVQAKLQHLFSPQNYTRTLSVTYKLLKTLVKPQRLCSVNLGNEKSQHGDLWGTQTTRKAEANQPRAARGTLCMARPSPARSPPSTCGQSTAPPRPAAGSAGACRLLWKPGRAAGRPGCSMRPQVSLERVACFAFGGLFWGFWVDVAGFA